MSTFFFWLEIGLNVFLYVDGSLFLDKCIKHQRDQSFHYNVLGQDSPSKHFSKQLNMTTKFNLMVINVSIKDKPVFCGSRTKYL